ncbi:hypothetical protein [Pleomorphomonas sp. JP5]|uniref:hypothetical protein n=1 Tax=Pleomorphomonas sp. JP5 TaxID=2942998 RepID=UPI00204403D1|nr:hypothetical protein [Pleomorphomonas sp. JP5]MCM5559888.1 hypothetical protein [Pleomorphomonas sp. JP5]
MGFFIAVLAGLGIGSAASAQPSNEFDKLFANTPWQIIDGVETRELKLKGNIIVQQERVGGEIHTITDDRSGHGAVMCVLENYLLLLAMSEVCHINDDEMRSSLMSAVSRIGEFAERNSIEPVTQREILDRAESVGEQTLRQAISDNSLARLKQDCTGPQGFGEAFSELRKMGTRKFITEQVDDLLSVERPAVDGPCY